MAKGRVYLGPKNFFTLVVLSVATLGVMLVTYASQQKTNTESEAAVATLSSTPTPTPSQLEEY